MQLCRIQSTEHKIQTDSAVNVNCFLIFVFLSLFSFFHRLSGPKAMRIAYMPLQKRAAPRSCSAFPIRSTTFSPEHILSLTGACQPRFRFPALLPLQKGAGGCRALVQALPFFREQPPAECRVLIPCRSCCLVRGLVLREVAQIACASLHGLSHGLELIAYLQLSRTCRSGSVSVYGGKFVLACFPQIVDRTKFLTDLARYMMHRVFKYYFSHS